MYLFFLIFLILISFSLIFLILLQPGKGFNNTIHLNTSNNLNFFNNIGNGSFIKNVIGVFSGFFLILSIVLCNINDKKVNSDVFLENSIQKKIVNEKKELKILNNELPH
ncbi:preprotein translocase subunit SecG [Buchnera aphidicola (Rhopalosiphum padi)]|uniref:Protein-export membrane protein SecG n=1 Tax=Buchnera aphidicola subsp. Rhopalosiphum padi TaxID=98793 RepID=A0A4D6YGA3_BUCRP|nr:preprotein translocase subunit SecG [Buchnera aphidicola]QCI25014.1 preprotein translocase subunit SecG [Buchnera aphidicola (Rhopalosiphum padi)]